MSRCRRSKPTSTSHRATCNGSSTATRSSSAAFCCWAGAWLVAARALQGLGAALVSPAALSIITTTFAEGEERANALGVWSAIAAGGGAFGLLLGGILTDLLAWEWIFFVNVPVGIATAILAIRYVPESRA